MHKCGVCILLHWIDVDYFVDDFEQWYAKDIQKNHAISSLDFNRMQIYRLSVLWCKLL